MGTENKSSKKKRKDVSPPSSSSSSQDEGKTKLEKKKKKKSKVHKSSSDRDKKSEEKHKRKRHKHDRHAEVKFQELSNDDYFAKNNEFATWLKEEKSVFFSDLSSATAHDLFSQFAKDWNKGKLGSRYYEGIASGPRTSHKWKLN